MKKLLSIQEAADILGVHPETLRRWDREGRLQAIKVGERGDRRYRHEDILMIVTGYKPEKYKDFDIIPHNFGFEISPGTLIRIASFIVRKDDLITGFAFAEGFLTRMAHPELKDEDLLKEAKEIIKKYIDSGKLKHLEEYTFEYQPSNFIDVENPTWLVKSLRRHYG